MKVSFITTNRHKFEEVKDVLKEYPIELEHLDMGYEENHDLEMEEIAKNAVKKLADNLNKAVVVEDTGFFFKAYNNFPGALPKFVFNTLGYKGIFKLLKEEPREAFFKTVAAFCEPGKNPVIFDGIMKGTIAHEIHNPEKDVMPYDRIFIPEGEKRTISDMSIKEKNAFSQRANAFRKFGEFIKNGKKISF